LPSSLNLQETYPRLPCHALSRRELTRPVGYPNPMGGTSGTRAEASEEIAEIRRPKRRVFAVSQPHREKIRLHTRRKRRMNHPKACRFDEENDRPMNRPRKGPRDSITQEFSRRTFSPTDRKGRLPKSRRRPVNAKVTSPARPRGTPTCRSISLDVADNLTM